MSTKATAARIYEYGEPDVFRFETMDVERRHHERCVAWRAWRRSWRGRRELDIIRPYRTFRRAAVGTAPIVLVHVTNSTPEPDGSRRRYFLRVPPEVKTARAAVAWTTQPVSV